jgi:hypothetical protein
MGNGIIEIRESEISDIKSHLNRSSSNVANSSTSISSNFSSFTNVGLFKTGSGKIQKQMSGIASGISTMSNKIGKQHEKMVYTEKSLTNKASAIAVPLDFVTNDNAYSIAMKSDTLSKEDGKAINKNNQNNEKKLDLQNSMKYNSKLKNIVKAYEDKNGEIVINGNYKQLKNIKSDKDSSVKENLDSSSIQKQLVTKINKELNEKIPELNMSLKIDKIPIIEVKTEDTKSVDFEDKYKLVRQKFSSILSNGNFNLVSYTKK